MPCQSVDRELAYDRGIAALSLGLKTKRLRLVSVRELKSDAA